MYSSLDMSRTILVLACLMVRVLCELECPEFCQCGVTSLTCAFNCEGIPDQHSSHLTLHKESPLDASLIWSLIKNNSFQHLKELNISFCDIQHLNVSLDNLSMLQIFDLSNNNIVEIETEVLKSLPSLKTLILSKNDISVVDERLLQNSQTLEELDLSHNNFSNLSNFSLASSNLLRLNLSRNKISTLSEISLRLENLQLLDLSLNLISVLDNSIFHSLPSLQWLNLSGNHLETLSEEYFIGLAHLQTLDISFNRISVITLGNYQSLNRLSELVISGNPLDGVPELTFLLNEGRSVFDVSYCNLTSVPSAIVWTIRILQLSHNLLANIHLGELESYPLLTSLDLSHNQIKTIEEDALGRLEYITTLILTGNRLTKVPVSLPSKLNSLHLSNNNIQHLNRGDLQGLTNLKELLLRDSNIATIQDGSFGCVMNVEVLDLSNNPIEHLKASTLAGPESLRQLRLSHLQQIVGVERNDMSFPVTSPERLEILELDYSPVLAHQLLEDAAALAAFRGLREFNLEHTNLTELRSDLFYFMPHLEVLKLSGNHLSCKNILWLSRWLHQHAVDDDLRCASPPRLASRLIALITQQDDVDHSLTTESVLRYEHVNNITQMISDTNSTVTLKTTSDLSHTLPLSSTIQDNVTMSSSPPPEKIDMKDSASENQFLDESIGLDSKLKFPTTLTVPELNSSAETTNVDRSFTNTTDRGLLSKMSLSDEETPENSLRISQVFNKTPTAKLISNSTFGNKSEDELNKNIRPLIPKSETSILDEPINNKTNLNIQLKIVAHEILEVNVTDSHSDIFPSNDTKHDVKFQEINDYNSSVKSLRDPLLEPSLRNAKKKVNSNPVSDAARLTEMVFGNTTSVFANMMRDNKPGGNRSKSKVVTQQARSYFRNSNSAQLTPKKKSQFVGNTTKSPDLAKIGVTMNMKTLTYVNTTPNKTINQILSRIRNETKGDEKPTKGALKKLKYHSKLTAKEFDASKIYYKKPAFVDPKVNHVQYEIMTNDIIYNSSEVFGTIQSVSNINLSKVNNASDIILALVENNQGSEPLQGHNSYPDEDPETPEQQPERKPEKKPEKQPENQPEQQPEQEPEIDPEEQPEKQPEKHLDKTRPYLASDAFLDYDNRKNEKIAKNEISPSGPHPGMFVMLSVIICIIVFLAVALSHAVKRKRRMSYVLNVGYNRQHDAIEVQDIRRVEARERW